MNMYSLLHRLKLKADRPEPRPWHTVCRAFRGSRVGSEHLETFPENLSKPHRFLCRIRQRESAHELLLH